MKRIGMIFIGLTGLLLFPRTVFGRQIQMLSETGNFQRPSSDEPENADIEKAINSNITDLRSSNQQRREEALRFITEALMTVVNTKHVLPKMETSRKLTQELIKVYERGDKYFSSPMIRLEILRTIALYGDDAVAKAFVLQLLDKGNKDERAMILSVVGILAVTGDDIYSKVLDLSRRGLIRPEEKTTYLARINRTRALPEVVEEVRTSKDKETFVFAARALQEYYRRPEDYGLILPRLSTFNLGKPNSFRNTNGLFWLDAKLFQDYVDSARGPELEAAMEFMSEHEEVRRPSNANVLFQKLKNTDPKVRILAAKNLSLISEYSHADRSEIKSRLSQQIADERDRGVADSMQEALAHIEKFEKDWSSMINRTLNK